MTWRTELTITRPADPGRQVVRRRARASTAGQLVYAIGDVHGCYDLLRALLADIVADAEARARGREPILVFLGDYVDRGPQSAKVLEALVWLKRRDHLQVRLLMGNHEQATLHFIDAPEGGAGWLTFGGAETLQSYGVAPPEDFQDAAAMANARDELLERMPASHLRLLQGLELMVSVGDYAFVHAGVNPRARLNSQTDSDLLWIRREFIEAQGAFEKVIVHGHTWTGPDPQVLEHRIGVDTGAYETGVLTGLRLEDGELGILQARGPATI